MNILYYDWNENSAEDMIGTFEKLGHTVKRISIPYIDYDYDPVFISQFTKELDKESFDFIYTFDFFPIISLIAQASNIPYISWVYDMPHTTLYSPQFKNEVNHIFLFDYTLYSTLATKEYPCHLYHLPLAVDTKSIIKTFGEPPLYCGEKYPITFAGSLYEKCDYNKIIYLSDHLQGYFDAIIEAQQTVYGYNFVEELLTSSILNELSQIIKIDVPKDYETTYRSLFANMLNIKITSEERINLFTKIANSFPLVIFGASDPSLIPQAQFGGFVDYKADLPGIFRTSKINLNITPRTIATGISQRVFDIMGAGGFLLSNYQLELDEYFVNGEDCVLFDSEEDLLNKVDYYMSHDKERIEITCNGFRKTREYFSYEVQVKKILKTVFGE